MIAYFDCFSGASGDMILGALVDAGWKLEGLQQVVEDLGLADACRVRAETVQRGGLRATQVHVEVLTRQPPRRGLQDILALLDVSSLPDPIRHRAAEIFRRLAQAEARVHGCTPDEVHFHEVGAVDALVDIVGAVAGLDALGVGQVFAGSLPVGPGAIEAQHGTLPLPAPATLELIALAGAPTRPAPAEIELVTPTGAAILTTLATFRQPAMHLQRVGVGAGGRDDLPWPNVLRLWLGELSETEPTWPQTDHVLLETNIDDMAPEAFGYVMERLFAAGALDVFFSAIYMKKNRPATLIGVIAHARDEARLAEVLLRETTTLGVRVQPLRRYEAAREMRTVSTEYGEVRVKVKRIGEQVIGASPEYEDCRRLAMEHGVPIHTIFAAALRAGTAD